MMARRLLIALLIALIVSGVFTYWLSRKFTNLHEGKSSKLQYVAAAKDLDGGETLHTADLQLVDWPSSAPLEGAILKPEDIANRTLLYSLGKGQPILQRQLSAPGTDTGLAMKIPDGMRAISLKSDEVVGVAGFMLPGTHIDVLVTYHAPGSSEPVTSTVLQDARILAAGQKMQPDPEGKPTTVNVVTLLATPYDAERVVLASAQGTVHFVLRNGSDHAHVVDQPAQMSELGEVVRAKTASRPASPSKKEAPLPIKTYSVDTLRGDKHTVENFQ